MALQNALGNPGNHKFNPGVVVGTYAIDAPKQSSENATVDDRWQEVLSGELLGTRSLILNTVECTFLQPKN